MFSSISVPLQHLNPKQMTPATSKKFLRILQQYSGENTFFLEKGRHIIKLRNGSAVEEINLNLLNSVLCRKSETNPQEIRVEVLGGVLEEGAYGQVFKSEGVLIPQSDGSLFFKKPQDEQGNPIDARRIVKMQRHFPKHPLEKAKHELEFARLGELNPKDLIVQEYKHVTTSFIVEKCIVGTELFKLLGDDRTDKLLTITAREDISIEVLYALKLLHKKMLHRDVKAENIIIVNDQEQYRAHFVDFGFARFHSNNADTRPIGCPGYFAPEILLHKGTSIQSDIYALGMVLTVIWGASFEPPSGLSGEEISEAKCKELLEFANNPKLDLAGYFEYPKGLVEKIKRIIQLMIHSDPKERINLDEAISHLQQIFLDRRLNAINAEDRVPYLAGYTRGIEARNYLLDLKENRVEGLLKFIEEIVSPDSSPLTCEQFCKQLGVNYLLGSKNKNAIIDKLKSLSLRYSSIKGLLETLQQEINTTEIPGEFRYEADHVKASVDHILKKCEKSELQPDEMLSLFYKIESRVNKVDNLLSKIKPERDRTARMSF